MFGKIIKRHCPVCNNEASIVIAEEIIIDEKSYYPYCYCSKCEEDLSKEDREIINKAIKEGKDVIRIMN
jgi:uncharacterized protein with PIN domain